MSKFLSILFAFVVAGFMKAREKRSFKAALASETGSVNIGYVIGVMIGVLVCVIVGLILLPIGISSTITAATATGIGSFAGVAALTGLVPLLLVVGVIGIAAGGAFLLFRVIKSGV